MSQQRSTNTSLRRAAPGDALVVWKVDLATQHVRYPRLHFLKRVDRTILLRMSANRPRSCRGASPLGKSFVSDDDAARALLNEVAAKEQAKCQAAKNRIREDAEPRKKRPRQDDVKTYPAHDYYGPASGRATVALGDDEPDVGETADKKKPDFGLSGALSADNSGRGGSNMYKGVLLKFQEPPEARTPNTQWRVYVFKGEEQIDTLHVSKQSAYLWGRNEEIADIPLQHPSCSSQHAVLQYRSLPHKETGKLTCQPYLMDLESTNGSFINGVQIDAARYYQLKKGDVLKFGASTREYVLLNANATSVK